MHVRISGSETLLLRFLLEYDFFAISYDFPYKKELISLKIPCSKGALKRTTHFYTILTGVSCSCPQYYTTYRPPLECKIFLVFPMFFL